MSTGERSLVRRAVAALVLTVALFAAVIVQLTVVNRLPLPGAAPDLVLVLVAAIAVATGPVTGALAGFAGGLALDVAPPVSHYAGEYALVFCLTGYAAARVARAVRDATGERDTVVAFTVMAAATAAGEAGKAALGLFLSDPDVTTAAVSRVLPSAIGYDLLLAPFAFWLVARVTRGAAPERAPAPEFGRQQRLASVFRQASAGAAPHLQLAGTGADYHRPPVAGRVPSLRLSGARASSSRGTRSAGTGGAALLAGVGRSPRLSFAGDGPARAARRTARTPGKNWLRSGMSAAAVTTSRGPRSPGKNWLRTSVSPAVAATAGTARTWARAAGSKPGRNWLSGGVPGSALASRPVAGRGPRGPRGPRRGWLSGTNGLHGAGSRAFSGSRGIRGSAFRGDGFVRPNWHAASPSGAWLRRSRHPWRRRSQRLLRLVGVGR